MVDLPALERDDTLPTSESGSPAEAPWPTNDTALLRAGDLAVANRNLVNCRAWMSTIASINGRLRLGDVVELLRDPEKTGHHSWVKVRAESEGIEGFVRLDLLDVFELRGQERPSQIEALVAQDQRLQVGDIFATTVSLRLRRVPGMNGPVLQMLDSNLRGSVLSDPVSKDGVDWIEARLGDVSGWIAGRYTSRITRGGKWIEADVATQTLTAWTAATALSSSPASTGKHDFRTPTGVYTITEKYPIRHLTGRARGEFWDIPGVPWIMIFREGGYYIHSAYWHDDFGTAVSHGCVTLPVPYAEWLYDWTPPGTRIWIHE